MSSEKDNKDGAIRSFARRLIGDDEKERKETREVISSLIDSGDKAKTEVVRILAKELRSYVGALDIHKDLHHLMTNYSLEVNASFSLKPLAKALTPDETEKEEDDNEDLD